MYFKINNDDYIQLPGSDDKVSIYKDTTVSGNLDAQRLTLNKPSNDSETPLKITNNNRNWEAMALEGTIAGDGCLQNSQTAQSPIVWNTGVWNQNQCGIRDGVHGFWVYDDGNTSIGGNLDVGPTQATTSIKAYVNHAGRQGNAEIEARWDSQGYINFNTANADGSLLLATKDVIYMYCGLNIIYFYKPTAHASDDRLKENEVIIESACDTLSKLRPQLYDKKPDIENDDPTTWYKESGSIAQGIYHDAPGLRHLVHRGKPEFDEEGNSIPLLEIPTSIDPQQDPDYSSWGKDPASVKHIGLIAYLVKASIELHERVKALESK